MISFKPILLTLLAKVAPSRAQWWVGLQCGDTITSSKKLTENYECDCTVNPAFTLEGNGVTLDLNNHFISCGDSSANTAPLNVAIHVNGKGNTILGPGNVTEANIGILLDDKGGHSVLHSTSVYRFGYVGVWIRSHSNRIGSSIVGSTGYNGIYVDEGFKYNIIENNKLIRNFSGIKIFGSRNKVENNDIQDGQYGIYIRRGESNEILKNTLSFFYTAIQLTCEATGCPGNIIKNNDIFECGFVVPDVVFFQPVVLNSASNLQFEDNHVHDSCCGLAMFSVTDSIFKNNVIGVTDQDKDAIVSESGNRNSFIGNTLEGGGDLNYGAIREKYCNDDIIIDNIFTRGFFGLLIFRSNNTVVSRNTMWGNQYDYISQFGFGTIFAEDNVIASSIVTA